MPQIPKLKTIQTILPLSECSLFKSESSRMDIVTNLKQNKLFRRTMLRPIQVVQNSTTAQKNKQNYNYTYNRNYRENDQKWLDQISYVEQDVIYQPKKIIQNNIKNQQQQIAQNQIKNWEGNSRQMTKSKNIRTTTKTINTMYCNKGQGNNKNKYSYKNKSQYIQKYQNMHLNKCKSQHIEQCFIRKMTPLKSLYDTFTQQKQIEFKKIWPNLKYKSLRQSINKLKQSKIVQINTFEFPNFPKSISKKRENKKKLCKPQIKANQKTNKEQNNYQQQQENSKIPNFLLSILAL